MSRHSDLVAALDRRMAESRAHQKKLLGWMEELTQAVRQYLGSDKPDLPGSLIIEDYKVQENSDVVFHLRYFIAHHVAIVEEVTMGIRPITPWGVTIFFENKRYSCARKDEDEKEFQETVVRLGDHLEQRMGKQMASVFPVPPTSAQ